MCLRREGSIMERDRERKERKGTSTGEQRADEVGPERKETSFCKSRVACKVSCKEQGETSAWCGVCM